jgi:hypothetical protein
MSNVYASEWCYIQKILIFVEDLHSNKSHALMRKELCPFKSFVFIAEEIAVLTRESVTSYRRCL